MKELLLELWVEDTGAETAEWLIIVALILAVAVSLYQTVLQNAINSVVTAIEGILASAGL